MDLAFANPLNLLKPKPAAQLALEAKLRTVANALQAEDVLNKASKMVNELTLIAHRSQITSRHLLTNNPTGIKMSESDAVRAVFLLASLKDLSTTYTELVGKPADHDHKNQPSEYMVSAAKMVENEPQKADSHITKFGIYRAKFEHDGSKPVDFLSFIPGTVAIIDAAIALRAKGHQKVRELDASDIAASMRRRAGQDIDGAGRVVKNEADTSGTVGTSEANKLNTTVSAGARIGVGAGTVAVAAMRDVADDIKIRRIRTPFDSLRNMAPEMA